MFSWLRSRQRNKLLTREFPSQWEAILQRNVRHYLLLPEPEREKMRQIARILVPEKVWEGCGGLAVTEEMQVTISAQAALPILGMEHDYYARVMSILVYPTAFHLAKPDETGDEAFVRDDLSAEGQAVYRGPVIVSWAEALDEGRDPRLGRSVVIHEFVHQLDFLDNAIDGVPPLKSRQLTQEWRSIMSQALAHHRRALERGEPTFFTEHAGKDEADFFADAAEKFFCIPHALQREHHDIYALLKSYFRLNPVEWFAK
jgi:Mlc titration factor MtfA (ptsG expression regulator)